MTAKDGILEEGKDSVTLAVNCEIYPLQSVYAAAYVFLDKAYVYLDKESKDKIRVCLFRKNKKDSLRTLGLDFYNELLNYAHYFSSLKANAEAIKLLMQRALFSASPSLALEAGKKEIEGLAQELTDKKVRNK